MRGTWALSSSALVAVTIVACATAGGEITPGTERFDAALPPTPESSCPIEEGSGDKWSDIYRDLLGPTGKPGSCSLVKTCHGSAEESGAKASNFFVCGTSKDDCRQKLIDTNLINEDDKAAPEKAGLVTVLRTRNPDKTFKGIMPKEPKDCFFTPTSLNRITTWIKNGFPND